MPEALAVCETFKSIQGESTYAGLPCFFIRLAGCNLDCTYCDTPQSKKSGTATSVDDLVGQCVDANTPIYEITGGEPLLQPGTPELAAAIVGQTGRPVLIETNGSCDITLRPEGAVAIMDIKTPGSGMADKIDIANLNRLMPRDEVKFVLTDRADYDWASDLVAKHSLNSKCRAVLFSPVSGKLDAAELGRWITEDALPVRLQIQLHKLLGLQ